MIRLSSGHWALALSIACFILALSAFPLMAQNTPTTEPEFTADATPVPIEVIFGPGAFSLFQPAQGLADLASYRATLTLSFQGETDGQPDQWSRTYTMLVGDDHAARQVTIETAGEPAGQVFMLELDDTSFERRGEDACSASVIQPGNRLAEVWEPARFLFSVVGADEAGTETVNGVMANHYTFDEQAIGARDVAESTGEMWVASDGDYLVRYMLETTGGASYVGPSTEGQLTWDYQLTDVNQPLTVGVPADCPLGLLNIPLLPDAADLLRQPGMTTYTTFTSPADAAAFYEEQLAGLGGEPSLPPIVSDTGALLEFTQGDWLTSVIATASEGITHVFISVASNVPIPTSEVGEAPASITVQVEGGGTVDIPLLLDATDVASMEGIATFFSPTEQTEVAAFYQEQLLALGGQIYTPLDIYGGTAVMEITLGDYLLAINIRAEADGGSGIFIRVDPPGTFSPISAPAATQVPPAPASDQGDCATGPAAIPILPDATSLTQGPGITSYTTQTSVTDAAAFYMELVAASGGQISALMPVSDALAMLDFTQGGQAGSVMIMPAGGANSVVIASAPTSFGLPAAECSTPIAPPPSAEQPPDTGTSDCMVSTGTSANQRSGPGTGFALAGTLTSGVSAPVLGQSTGTDGYIWWKLGENMWVRSDVVTATGDCEGVPVVQP